MVPRRELGICRGHGLHEAARAQLTRIIVDKGQAQVYITVTKARAEALQALLNFSDTILTREALEAEHRDCASKSDLGRQEQTAHVLKDGQYLGWLIGPTVPVNLAKELV